MSDDSMYTKIVYHIILSKNIETFFFSKWSRNAQAKQFAQLLEWQNFDRKKQHKLTVTVIFINNSRRAIYQPNKMKQTALNTVLVLTSDRWICTKSVVEFGL